MQLLKVERRMGARFFIPNSVLNILKKVDKEEKQWVFRISGLREEKNVAISANQG